MKHYTIKMFRTDYNTNEKCLKAIFLNRYGKKFECPKCQIKGNWYLIESRKRFDCSCGFGLYPLAGTLFEKSQTPLSKWFRAIVAIANGASKTELQKEIGVTYKCAWRLWNIVAKNIQSGKLKVCNATDVKKKNQVVSFIFTEENLKIPVRNVPLKKKKSVITGHIKSVQK